MSAILAKEESFYFSTDTRNDPNVTVSADGSSMSINLDNPIEISRASVHSTLEVQSATIWNVSPNISSQFGNNKLTYYINNILQTDITIADGQYSLSSINQTLSSEFQN